MGSIAAERPIGVYDSGVGGLTVLRQMQQRLPAEQMVYFGDTARHPYGNRSVQEIVGFSRQALAFFLSLDAKLMVAACNTVSALALPVLAAEAPIPVIGVIKAGAKVAMAVTENKRIGIIGTNATVQSQAYTRALQMLDQKVQVWEEACPRLASLVEAGCWDGEPVETCLAKHLMPLVGHRIDTLILGCTHYPLVLPSIRQLLDPGVNIVDPAEAVAKDIYEELRCSNLLAEGKAQRYKLYVSGEPRDFQVMAGRFGYTNSVCQIDVERL